MIHCARGRQPEKHPHFRLLLCLCKSQGDLRFLDICLKTLLFVEHRRLVDKDSSMLHIFYIALMAWQKKTNFSSSRHGCGLLNWYWLWVPLFFCTTTEHLRYAHKLHGLKGNWFVFKTQFSEWFTYVHPQAHMLFSNKYTLQSGIWFR